MSETARSRWGHTYVSQSAAQTRVGTASVTVTRVAASRSTRSPEQLAIVHAASGRNSADQLREGVGEDGDHQHSG